MTKRKQNAEAVFERGRAVIAKAADRPQGVETTQSGGVTRSVLDDEICEGKGQHERRYSSGPIGRYYVDFDEDAEVIANVIGFHLSEIYPALLRRGVAVPRKQISLTDSGIERNISLLVGAGHRVALMEWQ